MISNYYRHLGKLIPSERLSYHGIGIRSETVGLLSQYNGSLTNYRINKSVAWTSSDVADEFVTFNIDSKNELVFVIYDNYMKVLSLKTGNEVARLNVAGLLCVGFSPSNQFLYVGNETTIFRYDYSLNLINQTAINRVPNEIYVDESRNRLIVCAARGFTGTINRINIYSLELTNYTPVNIDYVLNQFSISKDLNFVYGVSSANVLIKVDLVNLAATTTTLPASFLPKTTDADGFLYAVFYNSSTKELSFRKYEIATKTTVYTNRIFLHSFTSAITTASVTQDAQNIYVLSENFNRNNVNISKDIYVIDKQTGTIVDSIVSIPDIYTTNENLRIMHTYEVLKR